MIYNVVAVCETDGDRLERVWYKPYGGSTCHRDSDVTTASHFASPWLFQGQRYCSETGLYYFKNRDMSPTLGRLIQRDPSGYADAMSLYEFVGDSPLSHVDAYGLEDQESPAKTVAEKAAEAAGEIVKDRISGEITKPVADPPPHKIKYVDDPLSSKPPEPVRPVNPRGEPVFANANVQAGVALAGLVVNSVIDGLNEFAGSSDCMAWYKEAGKCIARAKNGDCCCCNEISNFEEWPAGSCRARLDRVNAPGGGLHTAFTDLAELVTKKCNALCGQ